MALKRIEYLTVADIGRICASNAPNCKACSLSYEYMFCGEYESDCIFNGYACELDEMTLNKEVEVPEGK